MSPPDEAAATRVQPESEAIAHQLLAGGLESGLVTFASGDSRYTLLCRTVQVGDRRLVVGEAPAANARIEEELFRSNNALAVLAREAARQSGRVENSPRDSKGRRTTTTELTLYEDFLDAILAADRHRAADLAIAALKSGIDVEELYVGVVQESLHEVGRRWQSNTITVADEHAATAVVQYVLSVLFEYLPRAAAKGNAVVAGVSGERHQVGAHMIADLFEVEGWRTQFLGSDIPTEAILDTVERHDAQLVALGVTTPANLPALAYLVANIRSRFGHRVRIVVGGQAASLIDVTTLGADSFAADARAALALMRNLKGP